MILLRTLAAILLGASLSSCRDAASPDTAGSDTDLQWTTLSTGLRINAASGIVELDGFVAEDVHHPDTPKVYLEVLVCSRGTREHEALVVTDVTPSLVHAALLASGLEPGSPGNVVMTPDRSVVRTSPTGGMVGVTFRLVESGRTTDPLTWAVHADSDKTLAESGSGFVFAGSVMREGNGRSWYAADAEGTIVGLATFGTETIALTNAISHASSIDEPEWIANRSLVPAKGTPVVVRIERLD